jgi:serine/threonine protein kinase
MGVSFEVLAPSAERGSRIDLELQKARATTTFGRVRIALSSLHGARPGVMREVDAPRDRALDDRLAALGDTLIAVTDGAFVRVLRVARAVEGASVGIVSEYVEGVTGLAPDDPSQRVRAVRAAGLSLFDALGRLHSEHGLVHGAVKPTNVLLGARGRDGGTLPVRVFDLGVGAMASAITGSFSGDATASSLERAFEPAARVAPLVGETLCTASTWGCPGYVPIGHFAASEAPSAGTDLFGALATLWELLVGAPYVVLAQVPNDLPWAARAVRLALSADAALDALLDDPTRRDRLHAALAGALRGAHPGALGNWVDFFDVALARGARDPSALVGSSLRADLAALPDPYATAGTLPLLSEGEAEEVSLPSVVALEPGREYRAEVVLDYFSGGDAEAQVRTLRFRHVSMLGEGAMGSVHRVEILRSGEAPLPAALKLAVDDSVHNRDALLREAHVLRAQRLDGMTQFLALVELPGGALALMMSYQPGVPLDALLAQRRLQPAEAIALGRRLLGTLVALHADASPDDPAEVVHGDIKPGNVIVPLDAHERPEFGAAVLIDFGVSRLRLRIAAPPSTTTEGVSQVLGGTVGYMPVGHLQGGATPGSDVFAVAVVLYESLTGRMPWTVESAERFSPFGLAFATEKLMRDRPHTPLSLRDVPLWRRHHGWNRFFRSALAHADAERIPSAREALTALELVRRDLTFPALVALALLVAGAAGAWWFNTAYCPSGQTRCDGACAVLAEDEANCGACGVACAAGTQCTSGRCVTSCSAGLTDCAGVCRDLTTDTRHCGACGRACAAGQVCSEGRCAVSCAAGFALCGSQCRDTRTDRAHCGACNHACAAGQVCARGACVASCAQGFTACGGVCRDLLTDRAHCGGCGRSCESGRVCDGGRCVTSCASGLTDCAGSCRDARTDRAHCGACNRACGAGENCVAGQCRQECPPGLSICGGRCRDTAVDGSHCGGCNNGCGAGQRCELGRCALTCAEGFTACGGVCRDLRSDGLHCGACGRSCAAGERCEGGACAVTCARGFAVCDGACRELARDEDHCGACERRCDRGQTCDDGRCTTYCGVGLVLCEGRCRDTTVDESNCGACGRSCGRSEICASGTCRTVARAPVIQVPPTGIVQPGDPVGVPVPPPPTPVPSPAPTPAPAPAPGRLPSSLDLSGGAVGTPVR